MREPTMRPELERDETGREIRNGLYGCIEKGRRTKIGESARGFRTIPISLRRLDYLAGLDGPNTRLTALRPCFTTGLPLSLQS
jgi:hypothetical protein